MERTTFEQELQRLGCTEVTTVTRAPLGRLEVHTHPFEAHALILEGELHIQCEGEPERLYRPGDVFHLGHAQPHSERYGPEGVHYLVGRR
ncbi:MAG: cupin [Curvibacter sp.]